MRLIVRGQDPGRVSRCACGRLFRGLRVGCHHFDSSPPSIVLVQSWPRPTADSFCGVLSAAQRPSYRLYISSVLMSWAKLNRPFGTHTGFFRSLYPLRETLLRTALGDDAIF